MSKLWSQLSWYTHHGHKVRFFTQAGCVLYDRGHYKQMLARLAPGLIASLPNLFGEGIRARIQGAGEPDQMGWITLELPFEFHAQALERLLPLGGAVEVLEPIALRFSIQDYAQQILAVYSDGA